MEGYPFVTGNFYDAEGNHLFRLVRNVLVVNPRNCSKIIGNHIGVEIHDGTGNRVFKMESQYHDDNNHLFTTIEGTFFDRHGKVAATADSASGLTFPDSTKYAVGYTGTGFGVA